MREAVIYAAAAAVGLLLWGGGAQGAGAPEGRVLARVWLERGAPALRMPAYARLVGARGEEYVLVWATRRELATSGAQYEIVKEGRRPEEFAIVSPRTRHARQMVRGLVGSVLNDGRQVVLERKAIDIDRLVDEGFAVLPLSAEPLDPRTVRALGAEESAELLKPAQLAAFSPTGLVAMMLAQIQPTTVSTMTARLSGEESVAVGGANYTILTRNTGSGEPIEKATQYVYERLAALGLAPRYQYWTNSGWYGRNVSAVQWGGARSNEVVLVTAHLDNRPVGPRAPGADDNASGCVGVLLTAEQMTAHTWPRTVQYVLFTGEEEGLLGSAAYAEWLAAHGVNVVAVYNMDMIAWESDSEPRLRLHTRTSSTPDSVVDVLLACMFTNVVRAYGLQNALLPVIAMSGVWYSDHSRFWARNYPAILAIEDDERDFNRYYHTTNDTLMTLNLEYFTAYVKASLGTVAHLALGPPLPQHEERGRVVFEEGFDVPGSPTGWVLQVVNDSGTDGVGPLGNAMTVTNVTRSEHPRSFIAHRGTHFLRFNSWNVFGGGMGRLQRTAPFSTLDAPIVEVLLAWARDNEYADRPDTLTVECSTNGTTWMTVTNFTRFSAEAECWYEETCTLPAAVLGQPQVYLAFLFTSAHGNDCHLDSVTVRVVPEPGWAGVLALALACWLRRGNRTLRTNRTYDDAGA